jgi:hypothetical protein
MPTFATTRLFKFAFLMPQQRSSREVGDATTIEHCILAKQERPYLSKHTVVSQDEILARIVTTLSH